MTSQRIILTLFLFFLLVPAAALSADDCEKESPAKITSYLASTPTALDSSPNKSSANSCEREQCSACVLDVDKNRLGCGKVAWDGKCNCSVTPGGCKNLTGTCKSTACTSKPGECPDQRS